MNVSSRSTSLSTYSDTNPTNFSLLIGSCFMRSWSKLFFTYLIAEHNRLDDVYLCTQYEQ
ncbi:hypothetical protein DD569_28420 [Klebsiella pneumoniae]|nr:hypothetical protein DD569_28420 [Klebsiella pneumoniae]